MAERVIKRRVAASVACLVWALSATSALACSPNPPRATPDPREVAKTADLVAIVQIDGFEPLTAAEDAELRRLLRDPPLDAPFRYPAPGLHFSTVRVLKGRMPAGALIQNGATSCDVMLAPGRDDVLLARHPTGDGARIVPLDGTFYLANNGRDQAGLAELELSLSSSNPTLP